MGTFDSVELIPGLPEELGPECLTRLPYKDHRVAAWVCRRWRELIKSQDFYYDRKKLGYTHKLACLIQALNDGVVSDGAKPVNSPNYGITVFNSASQIWERLDPVPKYPNGLPLFCQVASCEGKLVVMGGWDPATYNPITDVFVYEFTTQRLRQGKEMPSKRSFFAIGATSGKVYVAGGHDESKNALKTGWVYDLRTDEWTELTQMSQERDECEGTIIGDEFWVVGGYATDSQGAFDGSADVYDIRSGQWRRAEGVWAPGRCPRSCLGVGKDGDFVSWGELDPAVRVGSIGVILGGGAVLVSGSEYQGGPHGFYMVEEGKVKCREAQNGKLVRISVPEEFSGFVQSGCCVEI